MKLLIAVGQQPPEGEPPAAISALLGAATEIRVLSPSIVGPLHWLTGDVDKARRIADERIADMLGRLEGSGADVSALRGDELAGTSFDDALRDFPADHVLLVAASGDQLLHRRKIVERLLDEYRVSVTVITV